MKSKKKINKKLFVFGLVSMLLLVLGATYAYFSVTTINNFGTGIINAQAGNIGTVMLNGTNAQLNLNLSAVDMKRSNANHYYATSDGTPSVLPNIVEVGHTSTFGGGTYTCSYTLSVTSSGNMYTTFQNMVSKSTGQIELRVGNHVYDFNTANLFPITVTGTLTGVRSGAEKSIEAWFKIVNRKDVNQTDLNGKSISINITATSFTCTMEQDRNYNNYVMVNDYIEELDMDGYGILTNFPEFDGLTVDDIYLYTESIEFLPTTDVPTDGTTDPYDVSYQQNGSIMASFTAGDGPGMYKLYVGQDGGVVANPNSSYMLSGFENATSIDLTYLDTSLVEIMSGMFSNDYSLTSLDLSNFDTSNVEYMDYMFGYLSSLTSLDVSNFDTSSVTDMTGMFIGIINITSLDLGNFDTSNVTNMSSLFYECTSLTSVYMGSFDTSNVEYMDSMFYECNSITSIDVSNFDTSNVESMFNMFCNCSSLTSIDVSNFNTSSVKYMDGMFGECSSLTVLDLSSFDTSNVISMYCMFWNSSLLTTIYVSNSFVTTGLNPSVSSDARKDLFLGCTSLVGQNGTTYSALHKDASYAVIDAPGTPGYFSTL